MSSKVALQAIRSVGSETVKLRVILYPGEVYRLPEAGQRVRVAAGQAWLTAQGRDVVLQAHESARLPVSREPALVSPVGLAALTVELLN